MHTDSRERLLGNVKQVTLELAQNLLLAPSIIGGINVWLVDWNSLEMGLTLDVLKFSLECKTRLYFNVLVG